MDMRPRDQTKGHPPDAETLQSHPAGFPADDAFTPLERLIHLLQGHTEPCIADAGIAALPATRLDRISANAKQEADACQERAELLLDLLESALENDCAPSPGAQLRIARHLRLLNRDQRRWSDLADNASYYRDNPQVAARIAGWRHTQSSSTSPVTPPQASSIPHHRNQETP